ncbi:hypothetical protein MRX96_039460 [Rhipicephalus microplus]
MLGSSTTTSFTFGTPAAATTSFSFGTNKPSTTFNFGTPQPLTGLTSTPATVTAAPATTTTATAAITQAPAQAAGTVASSSTMHYRLLEESVNQWKLELEELERNFIDQATQVNAWDRSLLSSAERVGQLSSLQGELERLLAPLEAAMKQAPALSVQQHADLEREHTYHMAENINSQLNSVSRDIKDIVEQLNAANAFTAQDKPLQQISKVLNSHMDALMWVQHNSGVLQQKLQELERACQQQRADPLLKR